MRPLDLIGSRLVPLCPAPFTCARCACTSHHTYLVGLLQSAVEFLVGGHVEGDAEPLGHARQPLEAAREGRRVAAGGECEVREGRIKDDRLREHYHKAKRTQHRATDLRGRLHPRA